MRNLVLTAIAFILGAFGGGVATTLFQNVETARADQVCCDIHTGALPTMADGKYNTIRVWDAYDTYRGTPIYVLETMARGPQGSSGELKLYRIDRQNFIGHKDNFPRRPNTRAVQVEARYGQAFISR